MEELKTRIGFVKTNYKELAKAKCNDKEFVVIAEKDGGGGYDTDLEALGVDENGKLIWAYCSGCSCQGVGGHCEVVEKDGKYFIIDADENVEEFYKNYKCEPNTDNFDDY